MGRNQILSGGHHAKRQTKRRAFAGFENLMAGGVSAVEAGHHHSPIPGPTGTARRRAADGRLTLTRGGRERRLASLLFGSSRARILLPRPDRTAGGAVARFLSVPRLTSLLNLRGGRCPSRVFSGRLA